MPERVSGTYKGAPYDFVRRIGYDEFEQRVYVALGNGAVSTYQYEPETRRLDRLSTSSGGITFQDLDYSYDKLGNVTRLMNDVPAPSQGMGGYVNQDFRYDALSRLTWASGTYEGADGVEGYTLDMSYSPIHSPLSRIPALRGISASLRVTSCRRASATGWAARRVAAPRGGPPTTGATPTRADRPWRTPPKAKASTH